MSKTKTKTKTKTKEKDDRKAYFDHLAALTREANFKMWLVKFVDESNRIEGLHFDLESLHEQVPFYRDFLNLAVVRVGDLVNFVRDIQPDAKMRSEAGMDVMVGSHRPWPGGPYIEKFLQEILDRANKGTDPYEIHCDYEDLHPFMDGNGRSGRMLWLWQMVNQQNYSLERGFLHQFYYQTLGNWRT